jgi:hypothetical protein
MCCSVFVVVCGNHWARNPPVTGCPVWMEAFATIKYSLYNTHIGGVVVSVLATGPRGRGFKPGQDIGFVMAKIIHSRPSFRLEVRPEAPCCEILRHVKELCVA